MKKARTKQPKQVKEIKVVDDLHPENEQCTYLAANTSPEHSETSQTNEVDFDAISPEVKELFDDWESRDFVPQEYEMPVDSRSLEGRIGYSSLLRQMQNGFVRSVAFYRSKAGGSLSLEESRRRAFHPAKDRADAMKELNSMLSLPVGQLNFVDLLELYDAAPRVAERFWEHVKREGRKEFESGHLGANITFPVGYMKQVWNIARYTGVRESFIAEWRPRGGIEIAMIDMLAQAYFQWHYWLEQTVKRSETQEKEEHPAYRDWKKFRTEAYPSERKYDSNWIRPTVSDIQAVEHAVQMADRFHRVFMRTIRQLRDLRRYSSVTINNANQVNIATAGGKQANVTAGRTRN